MDTSGYKADSEFFKNYYEKFNYIERISLYENFTHYI